MPQNHVAAVNVEATLTVELDRSPRKRVEWVLGAGNLTNEVVFGEVVVERKIEQKATPLMSIDPAVNGIMPTPWCPEEDTLSLLGDLSFLGLKRQPREASGDVVPEGFNRVHSAMFFGP